MGFCGRSRKKEGSLRGNNVLKLFNYLRGSLYKILDIRMEIGDHPLIQWSLLNYLTGDRLSTIEVS